MEINSFKGITTFGQPMKTGFFPELKTRARKGRIRARIIDQDSEFDQLKEPWDQLVGRAEVSVFQSFSWQNAWWREFGDDHKLCIIIFLDDTRLVGIAPFYVDTQKFLGVKKVRTLRFIGSNIPGNKGKGSFADYSVSDFLDVIVDREYAKEVANSLMHTLSRTSVAFDRIALQETGESSWVQQVLVPYLRKKRYTFSNAADNVCPVLYLDTGDKSDAMEKFLMERRSRIRSQIRQLNRIIEQRKYFKVSLIHTEEELEYYFPLLVEMHQKRWNDLGYPGDFYQLGYARFLLDVFRSLLIEGRLWFVVVETTEQPIAFSVSLLEGFKVYELIKAYDQTSSYAKYRPGNVAQFFMISHALQADYHVIHFLRGNEANKNELTAYHLKNYHLMIPNPTAGGSIKKLLIGCHDKLQKVSAMLSRERMIISVHRKRYGLLKSNSHYFKNLTQRIREKRRRAE